jgi:nucleotide-binding universal stress UspA family protein
MIKDIVVNLSIARQQDSAVDYAISVASAFQAHVAGIAFVFDAVIPGDVMGGIPVEMIAMQREENSKAARTASERFATSAKAVGIEAETRVIEANLGGAAALFGAIARRFDLAVVGQERSEGGASEGLMIEAALFESGRPVIMVPYIQKEGLKLERALACWDGSRTAARAIADAMPFLERAKAVELLMIGEEHKHDEIAGANMIAHLARHGVSATAERTTRGDISIENVILSYAADSGADFMVMGGYGHSRLREFVLGGVTRGILSSMTLPVLMSH